MRTNLSHSPEISLRQALEDAIHLVEQPPIDNSERDRVVLKILSEIFAGAQRGSEVAYNKSLRVQAKDKPAFEAFALLFKHLHSAYGKDLPAQIQRTSTVLTALKEGRFPQAPEKRIAREFLVRLLDALQHQSAMRSLRRPEVYS